MKSPSGKFRPPQRNGVSPSRVFVPSGTRGSCEDFLAGRFPAISRRDWEARLEKKLVLDSGGCPVAPGQPCPQNTVLYYYRSPVAEPPVPFEERIVYCDEWIVVADKPHFLPVIPSGRYLHETLLLRLKHRLDIETLSPVHRIDRETAGLVVFSVKPETRGLYQELFRHKSVEKHYEAIAPFLPETALPQVYRSRLAARREHFMQMEETEGASNAETEIRLIEKKGRMARYGLRPLTGKKHQLRVQMAALGCPIVNDRIYPKLMPEENRASDWERAFASPLQLLAKSLSFTDPVTQEKRHFESLQKLEL